MLTNRVAAAPSSFTAMLPQGSTMRAPDQAATAWPCGSSTMRQPSPLVAVVPSRLGRLPTITQPLFSTAIAVVMPTPPGHRSSVCGTTANGASVCVAGSTSTSVVPSPCRLLLLLKLLTSTWPATSLPFVTGETITAYGFWSPLAGTVETTVLCRCRPDRNDGASTASATGGVNSASPRTDPRSNRRCEERTIMSSR